MTVEYKLNTVLSNTELIGSRQSPLSDSLCTLTVVSEEIILLLPYNPFESLGPLIAEYLSQVMSCKSCYFIILPARFCEENGKICHVENMTRTFIAINGHCRFGTFFLSDKI